jgi:hypothetical protein
VETDEAIMAKNPATEERARGSDHPPFKLTTHPVISHVNPKPGDQRRYVILSGYVGEVTKDYVQVYPELDLRTYFRIPISAIAWCEPVIPSREASPTRLVVDANTEHTLHESQSGSIEQRFLSGSIAASNLGSARPNVLPGGKTILEVADHSPGLPGDVPAPINQSACPFGCGHTDPP